MRLKAILSTLFMFVPAMFGQEALVAENEDTVQPGMVRFVNLSQGDRLFIDHEEVGSKAVPRKRFELLLVPGAYKVSILRASGERCETVAYVKENSTVVAACTALLAANRSTGGLSVGLRKQSVQ